MQSAYLAVGALGRIFIASDMGAFRGLAGIQFEHSRSPGGVHRQDTRLLCHEGLQLCLYFYPFNHLYKDS